MPEQDEPHYVYDKETDSWVKTLISVAESGDASAGFGENLFYMGKALVGEALDKGFDKGLEKAAGK